MASESSNLWCLRACKEQGQLSGGLGEVGVTTGRGLRGLLGMCSCFLRVPWGWVVDHGWGCSSGEEGHFGLVYSQRGFPFPESRQAPPPYA